MSESVSQPTRKNTSFTMSVLSKLAVGLAVAASAVGWKPEQVAKHVSAAALQPVLGLSWAVQLGTNVWVSLISGIIMFRTLPRHTFG